MKDVLASKIAINTDCFGMLKGENVISFYDYPRIFTVVSDYKIQYVLAEYKADEKSYSWISCETNSEDIKKLDDNVISLQELFKNGSSVYLLKMTPDSEVAKSSLLKLVPSDCFVDEPLFVGGFISGEDREHENIVQNICKKTNSTIVSYVVNKLKQAYLSVPLNRLSLIIDNFKQYFNSYGLHNNQSVSFSHGSTIVNIIIEGDENNDETYSFVDDYEKMIQAKTEDDVLNISKINKKKIEAFINLNEVIEDEDGNVEVIIAKPGDKPVIVKQTKKVVEEKSATLKRVCELISRKEEKDILYRDGILEGILTKDNKFEFKSDKDEHFKGNVSDQIDLSKTYLVNGKRYSVAIEKKKATNGRVVYTLLSVGDSTRLF